MQMESPWDKGGMSHRDLEEVQDEGLRYETLFSRHGGVA